MNKQATQEKEQEQPQDVLTPEEKKMMEDQPAPDDFSGNNVQDIDPDKFDEMEGEDGPVEAQPKKDEPKTEDKKEPEKKEEPESDDPFLKIERELTKDEGQEDLTGFTDREKGYFFQMRKDRKARQKAEEDRDAALFREIQSKNKKEEPAKETEKDPFDGKDDTDFLTVGEVKDLLKSQKKETKQEDTGTPISKDPRFGKYLQLCEKEARETHEDYDAVMELVDDLINNNEKYLVQIAEAMARGENPATKSYELIKGDAEFSKLFPAAETRWKAKAKKPDKAEEKPPADPKADQKKADAEKAQKALEENEKKPKTTGHAGDGEQTGGADELTVEQLTNMSDIEFAALPPAKRNYYLKKFGGIK